MRSFIPEGRCGRKVCASRESIARIVPTLQGKTCCKQGNHCYSSAVFALVCALAASIFQFLDILLELRMTFFVIAYFVLSKSLLAKAFNQIKHKDIFNENTLMVVASFGALMILEGFEAIMVVLLNTIGEYYKNKAITKSKKSISELIDTEINEVTLIGNISKDVNEVKVGDVLVISPGEKILLECSFSERQKEMLKCGGLLGYTKAKASKSE
jgi:cation transport ATPase